MSFGPADRGNCWAVSRPWKSGFPDGRDLAVSRGECSRGGQTHRSQNRLNPSPRLYVLLPQLLSGLCYKSLEPGTLVA